MISPIFETVDPKHRTYMLVGIGYVLLEIITHNNVHRCHIGFCCFWEIHLPRCTKWLNNCYFTILLWCKNTHESCLHHLWSMVKICGTAMPEKVFNDRVKTTLFVLGFGWVNWGPEKIPIICFHCLQFNKHVNNLPITGFIPDLEPLTPCTIRTCFWC